MKYYKLKLTSWQGEKTNEPEHTKHVPDLLHLQFMCSQFLLVLRFISDENLPAWPVVILTAAKSLWERLKSETPFTASTSNV